MSFESKNLWRCDICDYPIRVFSIFYIVGEVRYNWTVRSKVEVTAENEDLLLNACVAVNFTLLFCALCRTPQN